MTKEMDLLVHTLSTFPEMNNPIKMEVGIEECLHIEFEYNKSKYDSINNKYSRYVMHYLEYRECSNSFDNNNLLFVGTI